MWTHRALWVPEARFVIASEGVSLYSCNELQREGRSDESGDEPSKNGNASLMPDYACIRDSRLMNSIKIWLVEFVESSIHAIHEL